MVARLQRALRWYLLVIVIIPLIPVPVHGLVISEIMYNPEGDDSLYEFLELYAENPTNVSGFFFEGITFQFPQNYSFSGTLVFASSSSGYRERYGIDPNFVYKGSLRNTGEVIALSSNDTAQVVGNYSDSSREGYSLEWTPSGYREGVLQGTPGSFSPYDISVPSPTTEVLESNVSLPILSSAENGIVMVIPPPSSPSCSPQLFFALDKARYKNGETVVFTPFVRGVPEKTAVQLRYYVEDSSGTIVKKETTTNNLDPKRYTPQTLRLRELFAIFGELRVPCSPTSIQASVPFLLVREQNASLTLGKIPSSVHYGDILAVPITLVPESGASHNLSIALPGLVNVSFVPSEGMDTTIQLLLPEDCVQVQQTERMNLSAHYHTLSVEKELLVLPSKRCNLPHLQKVYTRAQDLVAGKTVTLFVSFKSAHVQENDTVNLVYGDYHSIKYLAQEVSPLEFSLELEEGNTTVMVELRREKQLIDSLEHTIVAATAASENRLGSEDHESGESGDETFKKELAVSAKKSVSQGMPQIPKLYYVLFGISVLGNVVFLWKS